MRKPNFFIIGAPKCGTTSLAMYLRTHPKIFVSKPKEPWFFCYDYKFRGVDNWDDYLALFNDASAGHAWVGEASTSYLYSAVAVREILSFDPNARFVVMVRNPVDMAYSLHSELVWSGDEDVLDFEEAWRLQKLRRENNAVPPLSRQPEVLQYAAVCMLGNQVERLFENVARDQVHVIIYDDFRANPRLVYQRTLEFLGLEDDGRSDFAVHNSSKKPRSGFATYLLKRVWVMKSALESFLGVRTRLGILRALVRANTANDARAPLSPQFREVLRETFRADVEKLSRLLNRDLGFWVATNQVDARSGPGSTANSVESPVRD